MVLVCSFRLPLFYIWIHLLIFLTAFQEDLTWRETRE